MTTCAAVVQTGTTWETLATAMCTKPAKYDKPLCYQHWLWFDSFWIDECLNCHRFDNVENLRWVQNRITDEFGYVCSDCTSDSDVPIYHHADIERKTRHLYILKLDGGQFYVGQTNDLALRLQEHKDGTTTSTAGKHPALVWYKKWVGNRKELLEEESNLTRLAVNSPRTIRRIIADWQLPIRLLELD